MRLTLEEPMSELGQFLGKHIAISRRHFAKLGLGSAATLALWPSLAQGEPGTGSVLAAPEMADALAKLGSYLTSPDDFQDVSRGKPLPHSLLEDQKREAGLTRETWRLEVISDAEHPVVLRKPMAKAEGTAMDFAGLMKLADKHAVRFPKIMTCLNMGCPLGMGIWEGVPLREVVWLTRPGDMLRRVFYYGFHNDDPQQMFRSSLPIGRVLEDPFDLPPVILCYKLNGQWLNSKRGGPVRIIVPEAYGFKCVKWLSHVVLTNLAGANDTYAKENNDIDSPLKSFAATISVPGKVLAGQPIPLTGYAQVGIGGLSKVQVCILPDSEESPAGDPYFATAPWKDAEILPAPSTWGGDLPDDNIPNQTHDFGTGNRQPRTWPMRLTKVHWAVLVSGLPPGKYTLRSRAVDDKGNGQPMPRPFRKSGHAAIEQVAIEVQ
jgi:DMSO/TMAO reductase YedYZ molybdopterin-dependent catalytic subunit